MKTLDNIQNFLEFDSTTEGFKQKYEKQQENLKLNLQCLLDENCNIDGDEPIDSFRFSEMEIENSANE